MSIWNQFNWGTANWTAEAQPALSIIEKLEWIDARGNVTDLSTVMDEQYKEGVDGRFMPPFQHLAESTPGQDGATWRETLAMPRQLMVPVQYIADDKTTIRARLREMAQALNPKRGVGRLRVVTEDGLDRYINCKYETGMESGVDVGDLGWYQRVVYVFRAWDPYWYNQNPVIRPEDKITTSTATFFPSPPFRLGSSTIFTSFDQINNGDVEAWPIWTIKGPGDTIRLSNETSDKTLSFGAYAIPTGGVIYIDSRPGEKTVTDSNGNNLWPYVNGSLWPLLDGTNQMVIEMLNSAPGSSSIQLTFSERFLGV